MTKNIKDILKKAENDELFNYYEYTSELMDILKKMEHKVIIDKMIDDIIDNIIEVNSLNIIDRTIIKEMLDYKIIGFEDNGDDISYNLYPLNIYSMMLVMGIYVEPELIKDKDSYYVADCGRFFMDDDNQPTFEPESE